MSDLIVSSVKKILVQDLFLEIPESEMGLDDGLGSKLGLDSLGFVELRVQCERTFDIKVSDEEFAPENFRSIRQLAALIEQLQGPRGLKDGNQ